MDRARQIVGTVAAVVLLAVSTALVIALAAVCCKMGWERPVQPFMDRAPDGEISR